MAISRFDGWTGYSGGEALLRVGDEWPDDHALVAERPDFFEVEQEPDPPQESDPPVVKTPLQAAKEQVGVPYVPKAPAPRAKPGPKPKRPA